jgi:hypothetical protein
MMTNRRGSPYLWRVCLLLIAAIPLLPAQVKQDQPELCGRPREIVVLPPNVTANSFNTHSTLTIRLADSVANIEMPGVGEVAQVCPIPQGKLLVFGSLDGAYDIHILYASTGAVLDSDWVYDPAVSPDQRWLAYREFYAPQSEISLCEEYMLYDLSKTAEDNLVPGVDRRHVHGKGRVIYPSVPNAAPFEHLGLPENLCHQFRADALHWSPDSSALVFADSVLDQLSLVWVRLEADGLFTTYVHRLHTNEVCEAPPAEHPDISALTMSGAEISTGSGSPVEIRPQFRDFGGVCKPKTLVLHESDFKRAEVEHHPLPPVRKRPTPIPRKQ